MAFAKGSTNWRSWDCPWRRRSSSWPGTARRSGSSWPCRAPTAHWGARNRWGRPTTAPCSVRCRVSRWDCATPGTRRPRRRCCSNGRGTPTSASWRADWPASRRAVPKCGPWRSPIRRGRSPVPAKMPGSGKSYNISNPLLFWSWMFLLLYGLA